MKNQGYKVGLYSLPPYQPAYMHPAVAYLAGQLKRELPDVKVHQEDLNTSSLDYFLGRELVDPLRDIGIYHDFQGFRQAKRAIAQRIEEVSGGRLEIKRNTVEYDCGEDYKSRGGLLRAIEDRRSNPYYRFFSKRVLPQIESEGINLVGLSVCDQKQFVPAMVLSSMIKDRFGKKVKVVLGGNIITRNYDFLTEVVPPYKDAFLGEFFEHFDFLIHHEGETAFVELVRALKEGRDLSDVPKLIYKDARGIKQNLTFVVEDVNRIAVPDFDGFVQQGNHWTPLPVIPYLIGRGCDWSACSFCDIPAGYDGSRKRMENATGHKFFVSGARASKRRNQSLDKVVSELRELSQKYGTKYFSFSDEELAGNLLRSFVDRVLDSGLDIEWECFGRIENQYLDKEFCTRLRKAGCRFIQFGIESASQSVLDANKKGYQFQTAREVLRNTYEAGIMNHAFILTGLPGDNLIEASKLLRFLQESGQYLTTIKPISYKVSKWSPIALNPERFGVNLDRFRTPDIEQRISVCDNSGLMSRHKAMAFTRFLEFWIAKNHKVNPATSEYMHVQRLFLDRGELESFGRSIDYQVNFTQEGSKMIAKVYNGLVEEIRQKAYDGGIEREERQRFRRLYERLRIQKPDKSFDGVIKLANEVVEI